MSKLLILSTRPDLYSTKRLLQEASAAGFDCSIVDYRRCALGIASQAKVTYQGELLQPDVIVPRVGSKTARYSAAVIRQFASMNVVSTLSASGALRSRDKLATLQALASAGIPIPSSSAGRTPSSLKEMLALVNGTPLVVKLAQATQGSGVVLAETRKAAESLLAAFNQLDADFLVQEFVKEANGSDIRAFVVDGQVVAAMRRTAAPGEFRANLHQGGSAEAVDLTQDERLLAVAAARCIGLDIAGVDLLRTDAGSVVIETNVSPGLQGIEEVSGVNIAGSIISFAKRLISLE